MHELPRNIILDRDTKVIGYFWRNLWKKLDTKLQFSPCYNHKPMDIPKLLKGVWETVDMPSRRKYRVLGDYKGSI